jgi:hypothetical protein
MAAPIDIIKVPTIYILDNHSLYTKKKIIDVITTDDKYKAPITP